MARTVLLVRHGETEWNRLGRYQGHTDVPLSDEGRAQAAVLATRMVGRPIDAIVSSDMLRARETAEIIGRTLGLPIAWLDPDLRERGYGVFEGLTRDESRALHPDVWSRHPDGVYVEPPQCEPIAEVRLRVVRALARVMQSHAPEGREVVIVCHGGAMRVLVEATIGRTVGVVPNLGVYELEHTDRFVDARLW